MLFNVASILAQHAHQVWEHHGACGAPEDMHRMPWRGPSPQTCASLGIWTAAAAAAAAMLLAPQAPPAVGSAPNGAREGALAAAPDLSLADLVAAPLIALVARASFSSGLGTRAPELRLRPGVGVIAGKPIAVNACFLGLRGAPPP